MLFSSLAGMSQTVQPEVGSADTGLQVAPAATSRDVEQVCDIPFKLQKQHIQNLSEIGSLSIRYLRRLTMTWLK
jgi:hypothetical protein